MALIIDNNRRSDFVGDVKNSAKSVAKFVATRRVSIAICRDLLRELAGDHRMAQMIAEWGRNGLLQRVDEAQYAIERALMDRTPHVSDDEHVLALARVSGARLLYTEDKELIEDFKNSRILSPRGKVFKMNTREDIVCALLRNYGT